MSPASSSSGEIWAIAGRWEGEVFDTTKVWVPVPQTSPAGESLGGARSGFGVGVVDGAIVVAGGGVCFRLTKLLRRWSYSSRETSNGPPSSPFPTGSTAIHSWRSTPPSTSPVARFARQAVDNDGLTYRLVPG